MALHKQKHGSDTFIIVIIADFDKVCANFFLAEILYRWVYTVLIKQKGATAMINKKAIAQSALLLAAVLMIGFGIWRGEADTVLAKAIRLCMECVGIG